MNESAKAAIPDLILLLKDKDSDVRSGAAYALMKMGELAKASIPDLLPLLKDEDIDIQSAAKEALQKLGYKL